MEANITENHGHVPVMRQRMVDLLAPSVSGQEKPVLVDGTLGAGGHTEAFLEAFPDCLVIGIDRDTASLEQARERLSRFGDRFVGVHAVFDEVGEIVEKLDGPIFERAREQGITGALFDLGVSSMQLDQAQRGFAYREDAPLDMRMDQSQGITAAQVLNTYSHGQLARILKVYGEERFAGKIASAIVREREKQEFDTSARLVELLYEEIPAPARRSGGHPAKRTFQALRIEVNGELAAVENSIPAITDLLHVGGRAVYMSYQSLEDKIVKNAFKELTTSTTPAGLPMDLPGTAPEFALVTRGAEMASEEEIEANPRAASVRVRSVEKILADKAIQGKGN